MNNEEMFTLLMKEILELKVTVKELSELKTLSKEIKTIAIIVKEMKTQIETLDLEHQETILSLLQQIDKKVDTLLTENSSESNKAPSTNH
ncbi:hypothetical protein [Bacillus sp. FJAT-45350]|uniref:hypothetical protein n=1 Tax=Bacillus sp. FJAT-45350 TaxID=2011014 RepID=UPI000BB73CB4|nr:hypothetical protein [Bacillus sp. FJAT-45350]